MQKVLIVLFGLMLVLAFVSTNNLSFSQKQEAKQGAAELDDNRHETSSYSPPLGDVGKDFELNANTRAWFDRFLSLQETHLREHLILLFKLELADYSKNATVLVMDLFSRYVDYKINLADLESDKLELAHHIDEVEKRLLALENLRMQFFSDREIEVFFGVDKIIDKSALQRYEIIHDETLSRNQKRELIASNLANIPEQEKIGLQPSLDLVKLNNLKNLNSDKQTYLANVSAEFGTEVAKRFEKLYDNSLKWDNKLDEVVTVRKSLLGQSSSETLFNAQFEHYLASHFTPNQIKRIRVHLKHANEI